MHSKYNIVSGSDEELKAAVGDCIWVFDDLVLLRDQAVLWCGNSTALSCSMSSQFATAVTEHRKRTWVKIRELEDNYKNRIMVAVADRWKAWFGLNNEKDVRTVLQVGSF